MIVSLAMVNSAAVDISMQVSQCYGELKPFVLDPELIELGPMGSPVLGFLRNIHTYWTNSLSYQQW